jgi:hypothetical protein
MKDQHTMIKGYRNLNKKEIDLMNTCKELAEKVGLLCDEVAMEPTTDLRWFKEGQMTLQKGFMSLIRSIAKPTTF